MTFLLQIAYAANLAILGPVLVSMFRDRSPKPISAFQGQVENSDGLRLLVASLWSSIFLLSVAGLFQPRTFAPLLLMQVIYKFIYLTIFVAPTLRSRGVRAIPVGLSVCFLLIVIIWPLIIAFS